MPSSDYEPTTQDVARKIRSRTKDKFGNYVTADDGQGNPVPDFSVDTVPPKAEVSALITDTLDEVSDSIGADIPADMFATAKRATAYLVAANIELGYSPDQAGERNSVYDKLLARHTALLNSLQEDMTEEEEEESHNDDFPFEDGGIPTGWDTVSW